MPSVSDILRMRQRRRHHERLNPGGKAALGCSTALSLLVALTGLAFALVYINLTRDLPSLESLPVLLNPPDGLLLQPSRLYDRSGEHVILTLENPAASGREYLTLQDTQANYIPANLVNATLAASDPTFWTNLGYSTQGIGQGDHPTLAQHLVSDLLLWDEPSSLRRALRERLLAAQITARYGRQQVLIWYLNSANYGRLAFGADAAARVYFGKPASKLDLAESALLAAVSQAPALNPLDAPEIAVERGQAVIQNMLAQGLVTSEQASQAAHEKLKFRAPLLPDFNPAPAFANLVLEQLGTQFDLNRLERGGMKIITTLDYDLQIQVGCASAIQLARLEGLPEEITGADGTPCLASRLLPTLPPSTGNPPRGLEANAVVLDPLNGQVLALAVGAPPKLDSPNWTAHPPGSLLTPFIYLTGFTRGMSPATLLWDIPGKTPGFDLQNFDGHFHGPLRLRTALANDYVAPAAQVLAQVGADNAWHTARQLGMSSLEAPSARNLLDSGGVDLLEASQAFGVFSNQGLLVGRAIGAISDPSGSQPLQPSTVLRMEQADQPWLDWSQPQTRPVISPQLAYLVTNVLSDEPARWPSLGHPNPLEVGRPAAAKMGRTAAGGDAWTIGYTPQLVVGVWIGKERTSPVESFSSNASAALWHAILQYASRELPPDDWPTPAGITHLDVCDPSGMLPGANCPNTVSEVFLAGSEPTQVDTLYQKVQIDRETGRLATVLTPPELVEDRTYLLVPPEAVTWARQAGLSIPPESYDVLLPPSNVSPDVQITSPGMFAYVRGKVRVMGTANGSEFSSYRLQAGQGLNPQEWLQVGQDSTQPVSGGELGVWDTKGLSGLYALELLVVDQEQRVHTAIIQVSVDNQAPEIEILNPAGQTIQAQEETVTLQANVSDDLAVDRVDFYMDGRLLDTLTQGPFAIPWSSQPGTHTLRVRATDKAGNTSEASWAFEVK